MHKKLIHVSQKWWKISWNPILYILKADASTVKIILKEFFHGNYSWLSANLIFNSRILANFS